MPLFYLKSGEITSIQIYALSDKNGNRWNLTSKNNYRDANGNWKIEDTQCVFKNEQAESNRFQIVREKRWLGGCGS